MRRIFKSARRRRIEAQLERIAPYQAQPFRIGTRCYDGR